MEFWDFIRQKLEQENGVVLLKIIDHQGSSPGRTGFQMAVAEDGALYGSVGGGQAEYSLVEEAKHLLTEPDKEIRLQQQQHDGAGSGMICSGSQSVALYPLDRGFLPSLEQISSAIGKDDQSLILYTEKGITLQADPPIPAVTNRQLFSDKAWHYSELCRIEPTLYIFGAGHVGLALVRIFDLLDFSVIIYDNRSDSDNRQASFAGCHCVDYSRVQQLVPDSRQSYVVIMTFAHTSDEEVLYQMVNKKKLQYLGMMGSRSKVKLIFENLLAKGVTAERLDRIHAPVGLNINSRTAAEIAVSIAAEVIQEKNSVDNRLNGFA